MTEAFAKAWYKLLHRDMGTGFRYLGRGLPSPSCGGIPSPPSTMHWSPTRTSKPSRPRSSTRVCRSRSWSRRRGRRRPASAVPTCEAALTVHAFALRHRRIGRSTRPPTWTRYCRPWRRYSRTSTVASGGRRSRSPTYRAGGSTAIEKAAKDAGHDITVPFARAHGRRAGADGCGVVRLLEPRADGFRNFLRAGEKAPAEPAGGPCLHVEPDRTRDDGSHRRLRVLGNGRPSTVCSPTGPAR